MRTLHHWDEIGLLAPAERSAAGHRRYSDDDVRRLYRIVALRGLGLPLDEVGEALEREGPDLRAAVAAHLARVEEELAQAATSAGGCGASSTRSTRSANRRRTRSSTPSR